MIYAYYDKNGILREIINDSNNRQGSNNRLIYAYFERQDISDATIIFQVGDFTSIVRYVDHIANEPIPYNREINYKYFKDNTPYKFYVFVIDDETMSHNGTCKATITLYDNEDEDHETQGLLTFNIQDEIVSDEILFESQWQYLLGRLSIYEFFSKNGIIGRNDYIADYQNAPDTYKENQLVLTPSTRTSIYDPSKQIIGIKLFRVENGRFTPIYSSLDTTDKADNNATVNANQNVEITNIKNRLDSLVLDFSEFVKSSDLSQVAFTGNYNDLSNKPTIPTKLSDLPNDEGFITNAVNDLINYYKKSETLTTDEITARLNAIKTIKFEIYASLDNITEPQTNVIYLIGSASPYKEYAYIENVGFELIGSSEIDLTNYVQSDNVLNTDNIVVGSGNKKVKDSGLKIISDSLNNNGVPTTHLVQNAIREIHEITTISGDSGTITSTAISPYRLIIDENLVVYRRVSNDTNALVYHGVMSIDNTHFRDYFLKFNGNAYTRTYTENVSHTEFDELVENTPTDITYDSETKVAQLVHDGRPIGNGVPIGIDGFTPYFEDKGLKLGDVAKVNADLASKEYVDNAVENLTFGDVKVDEGSRFVDTEVVVVSNASGKTIESTPIKTINGESILGSGNIVVEGGSGGTSEKVLVKNEIIEGDLTSEPDITSFFTTEEKTKILNAEYDKIIVNITVTGNNGMKLTTVFYLTSNAIMVCYISLNSVSFTINPPTTLDIITMYGVAGGTELKIANLSIAASQ